MFEGEYAKKEREKVNVPVYDELISKDEQVKEIEEKVKSLIAIFNGLNNNKELLLVPHGDNLTQVYSLLCCLEEEVAKLLTNDVN